MSTKTVESAPSAMITRLSGTVAGSSMPASLSDDEGQDCQADEEHELSERTRVPADHARRRALTRAHVPAGEGGDGEDEP